ncbi:MAG: transporter substrate-binding domain-containing protein [Bacteroidales bacterium]|nr:transporter substrate-binding domain-containing protein [Bacteroidales bacterium]
MNTKKLMGRVPAIVTVIILVLAGLGFARRCGTDSSTLAENYRRPGGDTLAVAIEMSPLTYTFQNDTAEGFDYQILKDISTAHSVPMRFYPVAQLDKAFQGLYDGDYDLLVASIPATTKIKEYFPVTDAVYLDKQVLVQRTDTVGGPRITEQKQLIGDTVWIASGSPFRTRLRNMAAELGDSIFIESSPKYSSEHLAILTALGEIKQAVVNEAVARHIARQYPNLDISTPISFNQFQCWAVAPGDSALLDSLNTWLHEFQATPAFRQLADKYL